MPSVVGGVEHLDDRGDVLEAHRLRARLLLRHVVDAEELVVAEQQRDPSALMPPATSENRRPETLAPAGGRSPAPRGRSRRLRASARIIPIVSSVIAALSKSLTGSVAAPETRSTKCFDLGAVLLAAQVEPDRRGQLGRVADVPAVGVPGRRAWPRRRCTPGIPGGRRRSVRPCPRSSIRVVILRYDSSDQLTESCRGPIFGKVEGAEHAVVGVAREHATAAPIHRPRTACRSTS